MKGTELARAVRRCKKPVSVPVNLNGFNIYVYANKSDLFRVLEAQGDTETGFELASEAEATMGHFSGYFLRYID